MDTYFILKSKARTASYNWDTKGEYTFSTKCEDSKCFPYYKPHSHTSIQVIFKKCQSTLNATLTHPHSSGSIWINSRFSFLPKNTLTCRLLCIKPLTAVLFSHVWRNKFKFLFILIVFA